MENYGEMLSAPSYLHEFLFEACEYFTSAGYICNASELYDLAGQMGSDINVKLLLKTALVHSSTQNQAFEKIYPEFVDRYFNKNRKETSAKNKLEKRRKEHTERMDSLASKEEELKEKIKNINSDKEVKKAEKISKKHQDMENLEKCLENTEYLKGYLKKAEDLDKPDHKKLMDEIKSALKKAAAFDNARELMTAIKDIGLLLKNLGDEKVEAEKKLKKVRKNMSDEKDAMEKADREFRNTMAEIVKEQSRQHREIFNKAMAKNAVKSMYAGDPCLDKDFAKMTEAEKRKICEYIKDNARKFRTKLSRKIRTNNSNHIDMPNTIKKSCQTNGIPLRLMHQKPVKQKSNLILILDVSGSCKNASEMMLVFMHAMKEVFPGGCKTYAFTNRLYDISDFFSVDDAEKAAKDILAAIPRSGAYSNYEVPFRDFYNNHLHEVTGDSYVYFIGDARNNKNPSGEEFVKAIARKAKKAFWLNTESKDRWNKADSIIGIYSKYMTRVVQTETPSELLGFLEM